MNFSKYLTLVKSVKYQRRDFSLVKLPQPIRFDNNGDVDTADYDIVMIQPTKNGSLSFILYGRWNSNTSTISPLAKNMIWSGNTVNVPVSSCGDVCLSGYHNISSNCCWKCVRCEDGFYKNDIGNHECIKCPAMTIPNENRTHCVPLLAAHYFVLNSFYVIFLCFLSSAGIAVSMAIAIILCFHSKTPIVKSLNLRMSLVQLLSHVCLFIVPVFFIGQPTYITCSLRHALLGFLLTVTISVTLIKTEYLLRVFGATIVMSRVAIRISKTLEAVSLFLLCLLQILFSVVLNILQPCNVIKNQSSQLVFITCDESLHICTEILFVLILIVACLVQAFRAKALPEIYNKATQIAYAMLCAGLCLLLSIPLFLSVSDLNEKYFSFCLLVILGNYSMVVWLYGFKVKTILFYKEINTKEHFAHSRFSQIQREFSKRINTKTSVMSIDSESSASSSPGPTRENYSQRAITHFPSGRPRATTQGYFSKNRSNFVIQDTLRE